MKLKRAFVNSCQALLLMSILESNLPAFANAISMYDEPKSGAKQTGTIDPSAGFIPIYSKESNWIKIANPKNGDVGWVKSKELASENAHLPPFSFTQVIKDDKPTTYQVIQWGNANKLTPEQTKTLIKQAQTQQELFEKSMQSMIADMSRLFYGNLNLPMFMPVAIYPANKSADANQSNKPAATPSPQLKS
jgi:hypothetical protein